MADLPDYYTQTQISEAEAAGLKGGLDANKSATPVSRDIYLATDTHILYVCFTDGTWTGFDAAMLTQGILTLYANMLGGGFRITNIADPVAAQDAATPAYVLAQKALCLLLAGGTMSGAIAMGTNKITGLGDPTLAQDAATKAYIDAVIGAPATKEFFVPVTYAIEMGKYNYEPCGKINAATDDSYIGFYVPHDFSSITEAVVIILGVATATHRLNFYSEYWADGEIYNTHQESLLDQDYADTAGYAHDWDISGILSSLVADDFVGIKVLGDATNLSNNYVLGVRVKYS